MEGHIWEICSQKVYQTWTVLEQVLQCTSANTEYWKVLSKSVKGIVYSSEKQILHLAWYTKAVSSLILLIMVVEDWQRQVVLCSQVFINSVLCWLDILSLEKAVVVILTYIVLDIEAAWNKFCFQSSSCGWMISRRLKQNSLKIVLFFPKQQWSLVFGVFFASSTHL